MPMVTAYRNGVWSAKLEVPDADGPVAHYWAMSQLAHGATWVQCVLSEAARRANGHEFTHRGWDEQGTFLCTPSPELKACPYCGGRHYVCDCEQQDAREARRA